MDSREVIFVNDDFHSDSVRPEELDKLLSEGWRHFGRHFFRYSIAIHKERYRLVVPLRIRLAEFRESKSLRRIRNRNSDLSVSFGPTDLNDEKDRLFDIHKRRFRGHRPRSITHFLDRNADKIPCPGFEFCLRDADGRLAAVSFLDCGSESASGIYAMFDPSFSKRSLGILTILLEIEHAITNGMKFYYLGYAYEGESFYDYKKRFTALERFDWKGNWVKFDERV